MHTSVILLDNDLVNQKEETKMKYNMSTICKMNEFLGRDRNTFMT